MQISNYLKTKLINSTLRNVAYVPPTAIYLALYTASPTDADIGTEVQYGAYVRQPIVFDVDTLGVTQNNADITFPIATNLWGNVTHIAIRDALTGGNLLYHNLLTVPRNISSDTQLIFRQGQIILTLS